MKTSNILLAIFVGGITIYMLAAFSEIRLKGKPWHATDYVDHVTTAPSFRYLSGRDVTLHLAFSDKANVNVRAGEGETQPTFNYHMSGDTLVIDAFKVPEKMHGELHVSVDNTFSGVACSGCNLYIDSPGTDSLSLSLRKSFAGRGEGTDLHFDMLHVEASDDSRLELNPVSVDKLDLFLDNSHANIYGPVNSLYGSMSNNSSLGADGILNYDFKRDASSNMYR